MADKCMSEGGCGVCYWCRLRQTQAERETKREDAARLYCTGLTIKQVARALHVSEKWVKSVVPVRKQGVRLDGNVSVCNTQSLDWKPMGHHPREMYERTPDFAPAPDQILMTIEDYGPAFGRGGDTQE
jgi:hypothetical protein